MNLKLFLVTGLVGAGLIACGGTSTAPTPTTPPASPTSVAPTPTATSTGSGPVATPTATLPAPPATGGSTPTPTKESSSNVVQVRVSEAPYSFVPDTYSFQSGKTYTLQFNITMDFHTFTVADLGIDIYIEPGKAVTQEVTFTKPGTFKLVCTVHEGEGQVGSVIVS